MKMPQRDRLIGRPRKSTAERRAAKVDYTRNYRSRMAEAGVPDRVTVGEAVLQELLREAWSASGESGKKDMDIFEHRVLSTAMKRLLKLKRPDGSPQYSKSGTKYRFEAVLNETLHLPKPDLEAALAGYHAARYPPSSKSD